MTYKCRGYLSFLRETDLFCRNNDFNLKSATYRV